MSLYAWRILIVLMSADVVSAFGSSMILAGLSAWQRQTGDPVMVGWVVSSYLLVGAAATALLGRLGDIFGRKQVLLVTILITFAGAVLSALATHFALVIAGRAIQGVAAAVMPLCYGLVREHLPRERVPLGVSMIVATSVGCTGIALLIGGMLTDHFGAQSMFVALVATCVVSALVVAIGLPWSTTVRLPAGFDWLGGALFAPGIALLLYALGKLRTGEPIVIAALVGGIALLVWWWRHERAHPDPLIDVGLLANRTCLVANLGMLMTALGAMQITQVTSLLVQQPIATGTGLGRTATFMGALKLPTILLGTPATVLSGWLIPRAGVRKTIAAGALLIFVPVVLVAFDQSSLPLIVAMIFISLIGINLPYVAIPIAIMGSTPVDRTSEATGMMTVFRSIGQGVGSQVVAVLMSLSLVTLPDGKIYTAHSGYVVAYIYIALTAVGVMLTAFGLPRLVDKVGGEGAKEPGKDPASA